MSKLLIITQVYENYGAHDWDGEGQVPEYWKAKGGCEYVVKNIDVNSAAVLVEQVAPQIERNGGYYREHILAWEVVADDYLTEFEQSQLEYEGRIDHPATELTVA